MTRRIYLASSWRNPEQPALVARLREAGHEVYDFRNPGEGDHGFHWSELDREWLDWTPGEYIDRLESHPRAADGYSKDKAALDWADTGVLLLPSGRSAHLEAGYLIGQGKPVAVLVRPEKFEPELMYLLAGLRTTSVVEVIDWLAADPPQRETAETIRDWYLGLAPQVVDHPDALACRLLNEVVELCIATGATPQAIQSAVDEEFGKALHRNAWPDTPQPAYMADEFADVDILAKAFAAVNGIHAGVCRDTKMQINRKRHWHVTEEGILYSRPKPEAAD